jgi:hypothetical protein
VCAIVAGNSAMGRAARPTAAANQPIPCSNLSFGAPGLMHIKLARGGALYISPFALHAHPMAQRTTHLWNLVGHGDRII